MKIWKKQQLSLLQSYPKEVVDSISETIKVLYDNYGSDREVDKQLYK